MLFLNVGDLQIAKRHYSYTRNQHSKNNVVGINMWWYYTKEHIINVIDTVALGYGQRDDIVVTFLGDIYETPSITPEEANEFKLLVDYCIKNLKPVEINVVVGNHETTQIHSKNSTLLSLMDGLNGNVKIRFEPSVEDYNGVKALFLPYQESDKILGGLTKDITSQLHSDEYIILSHNEIATHQIIPGMDILDTRMLYDHIGSKPLYVFNGHLHNSYLNNLHRFVQVGSVSPTNFDCNYIQDIGIVLYDSDKGVGGDSLLKFPNKRVLFPKIESVDDMAFFGKVIDNISHEFTDSYIAIRYLPEFEDHIKDLCRTYTGNILYTHKFIGKTVEEAPNDISITVGEGDDEVVHNIKTQGESGSDISSVFDKYILKLYGFSPQSVLDRVSRK